MPAPKIAFLNLLHTVVKALDFLSFFSVILVLGPQIMAKFNPGETYAVIAPVQRHVDKLQVPLTAFLKSQGLATYQGKDVAPYVIAGLLLLFCWICGFILRSIRVDILTLEELEKVSEAEEAAKRADVAGKLAAIQAAAPSQREQVLEIYAQSKRILEGQRRRVAFLAADVINSTGMKQGEDPALAERDFRQYRKLVESAIGAHGFLKAAWTPDGVMICFGSFEDAVAAAQDLIRGLAHFNANVKSMRMSFQVRCGVNAGDVLYDDATSMEQMSDASIDLAGHLQKYAEPDTIFVPRALAGSAAGFRPVAKQVDGIDVSAWSA